MPEPFQGQGDIALKKNIDSGSIFALLYTSMTELERATARVERLFEELRDQLLAASHESAKSQQRDWARAADNWRKATQVIARRTEHGEGLSAELGSDLAARGRSEALRPNGWMSFGEPFYTRLRNPMIRELGGSPRVKAKVQSKRGIARVGGNRKRITRSTLCNRML